ncbi:MAG: glycosyl hydrolase 53 family protein, partial [Planctomycetes bacterium]|nr:glycosyl hydrolase 53 family protein [Planctomycetota bacterium]
NGVRLRIFVNPKAEGGYFKDGFCDLEHTLQMARRAKAVGTARSSSHIAVMCDRGSRLETIDRPWLEPIMRGWR